MIIFLNNNKKSTLRLAPKLNDIHRLLLHKIHLRIYHNQSHIKTNHPSPSIFIPKLNKNFIVIDL